MPLLQIKTFPDPVLLQRSQSVETPDKEFIDAMVETLYGYPRTVGVAAPQTGRLERVVVMDTSVNPKYKDQSHGLLVMINPRITDMTGKKIFREGCLSVPQYTGYVTRARTITVTYSDIDMHEHTMDMDGFEAIVAQHEIDHLDGVLFIHRIKSLKRDLFLRK